MATAADSQHAVFSCHDSRKWPIFNSDDRNLVNGMTVKGTTKFTTTWERPRDSGVQHVGDASGETQEKGVVVLRSGVTIKRRSHLCLFYDFSCRFGTVRKDNVESR
jgi:hypothetical protein